MRALKIMDVFCCFVWKIRVIEYYKYYYGCVLNFGHALLFIQPEEEV